jgi:hypothetical protein
MSWFDELFHSTSTAITEDDLELDRKRQIRRQKILETVNKVTAVAREGLEIYSQIKSKNPLSIGLGVLSAYGTVSENFFPTKVESSVVLREMGTEQCYHQSTEFIMDIIKNLGIQKRIIWTDSGESSVSIEEYVLCDSSVYFIRYDSNNYFDGPYVKDAKLFRKEMAKMVVEKFGQYVKLDTSGHNSGWNRDMSLTSMDIYEDPYVEVIDERDLISSLNKFFDRGLNRSMLFYGPPGSGKTTLALRLAEALGGSILVLSGWSLAHKPTGSIINAIKLVDPVIILFDDLDRIGDMENLLSDLETMNRKKSGRNKLFIATVNRLRKIPRALRRTGRFDKSIEFKAPNKETAKKILQVHADKLNLELSEESLDKLVELSEGMTGSDLREIAIRTGVLGIEDMTEEIKDMRRVAEVRDEDDEDEDASPDMESELNGTDIIEGGF